MKLTDLPTDLIELIFEQLPFSSKVTFTSISQFKFLRKLCPQTLLTEFPALILTYFYEIPEYEDYFSERYPYFLDIIADKSYQVKITNGYYQVFNGKTLVLSLYEEPNGPNKRCLLSSHYYKWTLLIVDGKEKFEYYYDENLSLIEICYYKNDITYKITQPLYDFGLDISLHPYFELYTSQQLRVLSPLAVDLKEKSFGAKTIDFCDYWVYSKDEDHWTTHKIVSIELVNNVYRVRYQIKIPIIYIELDPVTDVVFPNFEYKFTPEQLTVIKNYYLANKDSLKPDIVYLFGDDKQGLRFWTGSYGTWFVYACYRQFDHGPAYTIDINEEELIFRGYIKEDSFTGIWSWSHLTVLYLEGVNVEERTKIHNNEPIVTKLIDPQYHNTAKQIYNYEHLQYKPTDKDIDRPYIKDDFIIKHEYEICLLYREDTFI